ncbi:uncharacterized protein LOC131000121 [Salvia miltiorrhiza]|uniref:uncharacterized protein LOC131000121 n=1 Tax=Salvia miltiorrhiza TaxID=226208 RepID=UPI0025AC1F13|nr:uncharacterized protein LOC131000121 [Salvia miltiorrhiza]
MDTSDIVVSSIRAGMKREFAFMMKAQSEMGGLPAGRRVTRSQRGASSRRGTSSRRGYVVSESKINKKRKGSASKKSKKIEEDKAETEDVVKLELSNVLDGDNGAERVVDIVSDMGDCTRNLEADLVTVMGDEAEEKVGARNLEADSVAVVGDETEEKAGARNLEADSVAVVGDETEEKVSASNLEVDSVAVVRGEAEEKVGARNLEVDIVAKVGDEADEKVSTDSREGIVQPLCTDSPVDQVGGSDRVSTHEDDRILSSASDLGCESTAEHTSMALDKPLRRFTRSALKLQDGTTELGSGAGAVKSMTTSPSKLEMKMSKKIGLKRNPFKLKDLLDTGLLEGLHVCYVNGSKGRRRPETELQGVIKGIGILCSCDECEGKKVVTPNQFELHARSGNKRPPEYIYLENGKSLRDVLNACKANPSDSLEGVIQNAIGRSNYTTAFCLNCRGLIPETGAGRAMLLCDSCVLPKESGPSQTQISDATLRSPLAGSPAPVSSSCLPEVLDSVQISSNSQPQVKSQGKLTRKDLRMHKSVLAEDLLPDGTALSYVMHGKIRLEGYKKDGSIFCFCCKKVVSPSQFEAHAGFASRRKPYMSIYTSNGVSLHQLSLELSRSRKSSTEENDDLCSICEDGGDLLCCENCPRAFHTECVGLSNIPQGIWYCKYCENMFEKEKFAENNANAIAAGRVPGVDPLEDITRRCIRIVANVEKYIGGGCVICRVDEFSKSGFNDHTVMICDQCEREYHVKCLREQEIDDLKALPETEWFCSKECSSIHSILQKMIGDGDQRLPEAVFHILEKKGDGQGSEDNPKLDVRWRLLRGKVSSEDTRVWLSGAVTIFHDRFDPIADASTSRLDLIPTMVYGRKFKDQEFYGMYCAILTVGSAVVSAAIVRVFGEEVAELPLVATRSDCQGKGYFQALFACIEDLLSSLNIKDLVLPAADEAESLWKTRFGFEKLAQEKLDEYKKSYQLMIFEGTSVLHKSMSKS